MSAMAATISELLSLRQVSSNLYESIHYPEKLGNAANQAYGGNTLAVAICAALQDVPSGYHLYSALGNFLGPAFVDRSLRCSVRSLRTTKTFATRLVEVSQIRDDGEKRLCLFVTADFQIEEPATMLTYSTPPRTEVSPVQNCPTVDENRKSMVARGLVGEEVAETHGVIFALADRLFERRPCPEGVDAQNLTGMAKKGIRTSQDHLPIYQKTTADYFRSRHALKTAKEHTAAMAFVMDMGISFIPLVHSGQSLTEVGVQSSLEFALRIFVNDLDLNAWNLREMTTVTGGDGRTYTESRVWDANGRMVSNMTQQCILRPKLERASKM